MKFLLRLIITATAVYILSQLLEPHVQIASFGTAMIFALVLSFMNAVIKPILIIVTLPLTIISLGLFLWIINVLIILLADHFVAGIDIDGFFWALIFGFLLSLISSAFQQFVKDKQ